MFRWYGVLFLITFVELLYIFYNYITKFNILFIITIFKTDAVSFVRRRLAISTIYYNNIIYLYTIKKKKLLSHRATYYTLSGTLCLRQRPDNTPAGARCRLSIHITIIHPRIFHHGDERVYIWPRLGGGEPRGEKTYFAKSIFTPHRPISTVQFDNAPNPSPQPHSQFL